MDPSRFPLTSRHYKKKVKNSTEEYKKTFRKLYPIGNKHGNTDSTWNKILRGTMADQVILNSFSTLNENLEGNGFLNSLQSSCFLQIPEKETGNMIRNQIYSQCITFENVTYSVSQGWRKGQKTILNNVSGIIKIGELTGILGPSGSGKTSLMNLLSGYKEFISNRRQSVTGRILLNGKDRDIKKFRMNVSYIMQEDYLYLHFTVKETMMIAANLKLSKNTSSTKKAQMVQEILEKLNLIKCENTKVVNISGGERKRLCIALEFINFPYIMFLDEPTSGLDSTSCNNCISILRSIVNEGHTVICTIHQPSFQVLEYFDKLIVMAEGQVVFEGKAGNMLPFLSSMNFHCPIYCNPADVLLDVIRRKKGKYIPELALEARRVSNSESECIDSCYRGKEQSKSYFLKNDSEVHFKSYNTSNWNQFRVLLMRSFLVILRDKFTIYFRLFFNITIGLILGNLYLNIGSNFHKAWVNTMGLHLELMVVHVASAFAFLVHFPTEREIIRRERLNNWYSLKNYYLANTIADLPFQMVFAIILATIFYWMSDQSKEAFRFFYFLLVCVMLSLSAVSFIAIFAAGFNLELATAFSITVFVPLFIVGGLTIWYSRIPTYLRWMGSLSHIAYAYEGMLIAIYGYNRVDLRCTDINCLFSSPKVLLTNMGITNDDICLDIIGLVVCIICFRILSYVALYLKLRH